MMSWSTEIGQDIPDACAARGSVIPPTPTASSLLLAVVYLHAPHAEGKWDLKGIGHWTQPSFQAEHRPLSPPPACRWRAGQAEQFMSMGGDPPGFSESPVAHGAGAQWMNSVPLPLPSQEPNTFSNIWQQYSSLVGNQLWNDLTTAQVAALEFPMNHAFLGHPKKQCTEHAHVRSE